MNIVFATANLNKVREVEDILRYSFKIHTPSEYGITEDIPETGDTLEENALLKARYVHKKTGMNCFADDTGLEVEALNGEPGVRSARYAGEGKDFRENMELLLSEMREKKDRNARFRSVIALIFNEKEYLFEGVINGSLTEIPAGEHGFGYDPIFIPEGYDITFAQMPESEKNKISHRAIAIKKLTDFLLPLSNQQ